ncbi:hypothetical protein LINGRAHAP2_LOCUS3877 [Linum grandiflorum]
MSHWLHYDLVGVLSHRSVMILIIFKAPQCLFLAKKKIKTGTKQARQTKTNRKSYLTP